MEYQGIVLSRIPFVHYKMLGFFFEKYNIVLLSIWWTHLFVALAVPFSNGQSQLISNTNITDLYSQIFCIIFLTCFRILFSAPLACGAYFCLWYVPDVSETGKFVWYFCFYCGFQMFLSVSCMVSLTFISYRFKYVYLFLIPNTRTLCVITSFGCLHCLFW